MNWRTHVALIGVAFAVTPVAFFLLVDAAGRVGDFLHDRRVRAAAKRTPGLFLENDR